MPISILCLEEHPEILIRTVIEEESKYLNNVSNVPSMLQFQQTLREKETKLKQTQI